MENSNRYISQTISNNYDFLPKYKWKLVIGDNPYYSVVIPYCSAPNWFWRWTQRLILGFKWTKL